MSSRAIWFWVLLAAGLLATILLLERHKRQQTLPPVAILPNLKARSIEVVQVTIPGQRKIRAERSNGGWQLLEPVAYPADAAAIERLLKALEELTPAAFVTAHDLAGRAHVEEEFGVTSTLATTIVLGHNEYTLLLGAKTLSNDQMYLQVVGTEGFFVIGIDLLKFVPKTENDWRDRTLISLNGLAFDRLLVTRGNSFELQRDPASKSSWRIAPMQARADDEHIQELLQELESLRVRSFVTDDPKADVDTFGLQTPELQITFSQGTNNATVLQFGKSLTNDPQQVYARRAGKSNIFSVSTNLLGPWKAPVNDFRDHRLVSTRAEIDAIEIKADEQFSVYQTNGVWRLTPANFPPDTFLVKELLSNLMEMQISEFTKDVVTEADLPHYGLASAAHEYILKSEPAKVAAGSSNATVAHLKFGTTNQGKVYVRRTDEIPVYAVELGALQRLPSAAFQLRDRQVWQFTEDDVATATVRSGAKARQFISRGDHHWTLAAGSQGIYNSLAVDQTIRGLGQTLVSGWVARGAQNRARFGFVENGNSVTLELKRGEKLVLEYAGQSSTGFPYGGINLDGEFWIFEMPPLMARDVVNYLSIPADAP